MTSRAARGLMAAYAEVGEALPGWAGLLPEAIALARLDEPEAMIYVDMAYMQGMSLAECAAECHISMATVRRLIDRGIAAIWPSLVLCAMAQQEATGEPPRQPVKGGV